MPNLTQIELPSGSTYDLIDQGARDLIAALNNWDYLVSTNAASTPYGVQWDDDGTTITGTLVASADTTYKIYLVPTSDDTGNDGFKEYITITKDEGVTYQWEMFGTIVAPDLSNYVRKDEVGTLAYKNSASGSGTVAVPQTYTTTITPVAKDVIVSGITAGTVNVTKSAVTVSKANSGTATYTPEGNVTAPTISVGTAGSTTTIKNPTSKTVVTDMSVANPNATEAEGELVYCSVSGTKLSLKKFIESTGDSITTTNVTVKDGDATYEATAPTFTGTGARLVTDSEVATSATFSGRSINCSGSYTPAAPIATTVTDTTETKTVNVTVS